MYLKKISGKEWTHHITRAFVEFKNSISLEMTCQEECGGWGMAYVMAPA
jgi:hypothetical protein